MENFCQAWHVLSNLRISSRNYVRPGKTVQLKDVSGENSLDTGEATLQSSSTIHRSMGSAQTHQYFNSTNASANGTASSTINYFPATGNNAAEPRKIVGMESGIRPSVMNSHSQIPGGSVSNHSVHTSHVKEAVVATDIDDDDILEVISCSTF